MITLVQYYFSAIKQAKKVVQQVSCFARGASSVEDLLAYFYKTSHQQIWKTSKKMKLLCII